MLPSFRLIVITFACSFALVFASLKLMESSRVMNEPLSVPLAVLPHSDWPVQFASLTDRRSADDSTPVMFDLRFGDGASSASAIPVGLTLHAIDRAKDPIKDQTADQIIDQTNGRAAQPERNERSGDIAVAPAPMIAPPDVAQSAEQVEQLAPAIPVVPVVVAALEPPATAAPAPVAKQIIAPEPVAAAALEPETVALPAPAAAEPTTETRIEVAALPSAASEPIDPPSMAGDVTASIDLNQPEAVPTAGVSRPMVVTKPAVKARVKAKAKAAKAVRVVKVAPKRKVRPRVVRRPTTTTAATTAPSPFSGLFGSAQQ